MDIVYIHGLEIETVIGIYDWEKKIRQTVCIDLEMAARDIRKAAKQDEIEYALDYKAVAKRIIAFVESNQFHLIETVAEKVAEIVRHEFKVPWLRLRLGKPGAVTGSKDVGVIIERGTREPGAEYQ